MIVSICQGRVLNQAAYTIGKKASITLLPRSGHLVSELSQVKPASKLTDIISGLKPEVLENRDKSQVYFCPNMTLINVQILQDQSKSCVTKSAALILSDKSKLTTLAN